MYILLSADFLAATQILVYVGGTLTLILFAVMLTARIEDRLGGPGTTGHQKLGRKGVMQWKSD